MTQFTQWVESLHHFGAATVPFLAFSRIWPCPLETGVLAFALYHVPYTIAPTPHSAPHSPILHLAGHAIGFRPGRAPPLRM